MRRSTIPFRVSLLVVLFGLPGKPVHAHRVEVDYIREGDGIKIEAFYPGSGEPAVGAHIVVTAEADRLIAEGDTGAEGAFTFSSSDPGPFTVVAVHGGHRAETTIAGGVAAAAPAHIERSRIHRDPVPALNIAAGLGLLFGVAGFVLALLAWRRVKALAERLEGKPKDGGNAL